jgi:hypothetical protein
VWPVGLLVLIKAAAEGDFPKRPENGYFAQTAKYVLHSIFEAFLNVATIKKTPVLKSEELYQGLIEPG